VAVAQSVRRDPRILARSHAATRLVAQPTLGFGIHAPRAFANRVLERVSVTAIAEVRWDTAPPAMGDRYVRTSMDCYATICAACGNTLHVGDAGWLTTLCTVTGDDIIIGALFRRILHR